MAQQLRTRFAPSPTGYMHIGGVRTALYSFLYAKKKNGKFILRIEDTDQGRYVEGAVEIIYRTLRETGIMYDEGPDVGGDYGPYIQSERKTNTYTTHKNLWKVVTLTTASAQKNVWQVCPTLTARADTTSIACI